MAADAALVETLQALSEEDLLRTLQDVLHAKTGVLQELVEWAAPDLVYSSARVLESRYVGTIKSYVEATGYGFISSPDITAAFGKDLFLSTEQIDGRGHPLGTFSIGSLVSFAILLNRGKPQAYDLCPAGGQDAPPAPPAAPTPPAAPAVAPPPAPPPMIQSGGQQWQAHGQNHLDRRRHDGKGSRHDRREDDVAEIPRPPRMKGGVARDGERRYRAPVKSYVPDKGYGFLECPELAHIFGKADIFIHAVELGNVPPPRAGQVLSFVVRPDHSGKPMATGICLESDGERGHSRDHSASDHSWGGGGWHPSPSWGAHPRSAGGGKVGETGRRYTAPVKSFVASKGYGFIACEELVPEFGKPDVFLHAREMGDLSEHDLRPGALVSFEVALDNGRPMAIKLGLDSGKGGPCKRPRLDW